MAIFKCKMCGGALEINNNETVATCEYCGTQQTLPKLDDDKCANMYDRANHFRRNNEFDKAMGIYEQILNEDNTDAEAYWSLVLCRYGIEYVEDPASHKRVPTINRAQFTSIFDDDNYKSALQYADGYQRNIYEEEAKTINEIQKEILAISQKEEPFDVFICYKETDNNGRRTQDSVLANDLYHQLIQEGFKVFFSRITLEDKLGTAYEPYIFAALNSAKVMVVLGTKPEYFNAVWVKNEWSRYLALIKQGKNKMLIPAYRDMNPYDLPEEFSHLQAQDMSKLGFMQDLIRGIKKIAQADAPKATVVKETIISGGNANTESLLKRAFMFLEDGEWNSADEYCEKVLDIDPECAKAYLGKLMAELKVRKQELLKDQSDAFDGSNNYKKVMRFGDEKINIELASYVEKIKEKARIEKAYKKAVYIMKNAKTVGQYIDAAKNFEVVSGYKDSDDLAAESLKKTTIKDEEKEKCELLFREYLEVVKKEKICGENASQTKKWLNELNKQHFTLASLKNDWWRIEDELNSLFEREKAIQTKISSLSVEMTTLGFFAGKQRKKIREEIDSLEIEKYVVKAKINSNINRKQGYTSVAQIDNSLRQISQQINDRNIEMQELVEKSSQSIRQELTTYAFGKKLLQLFELLQKIKYGDCITFGHYKQVDESYDDNNDIEWIVLDVKENKALLISKYAIACKPYNTESTEVTWETCSLRKWLNYDFVKDAFSAEEEAVINRVTTSENGIFNYNTKHANETKEQVLLLSITEVNKYFGSDSARRCDPMDYVVANGARESNSGNCWWVRSPGSVQTRAAYVDSDGKVDDEGCDVSSGNIAVRPALWLDLNA